MRLLVIPVVLLLSACSHVDTGEIDYRRAEPEQEIAKNVSSYPGSCAYQPFDQLVDSNTGSLAAGREQACLPLLAGKLFRKNVSVPESKIAKNDVYSIRLEHGLISFMTEPGFSFERIVYGERMRVQVGEIVILANVFEFGEENKEQQFVDLTDLNQVKVIYYSPDVEAGQDLNFSNIPLKAPATYNGNPIGIQIIVLELDRMSSQMQSLLKTLAGIGQQSNLAPSGPVGSLLLNLGTSMLTQNNDDTIFEYRFVLDPSDGTLSVKSAPFEAGRYVIKRTHDRRKDQVWRNLAVDHNTGRLIRMSAENKLVPPTPFTEETYFTVNVIKHPEGTSAAGFGFKTLDELGDEIEEASASRDAPFKDLDTALKVKLADMRRSSRADDLVKGWQAASSKFRAYAQRMQPEGITCATVSDYTRKLAQAKFEAVNAAVEFHRMYREAITETDSESKPVFGTEHKRRVLKMMAPYFLPEQEQEGSIRISDLVSPDTFDSTYATDDYSALLTAMEIMANTQWRAKSCDELVADGLARSV